MVTNVSGSQYRLLSEAKCDTFGAIWRILGVNNSAQRVFGEATGFSLLLTTLHSFQSDGEHTNQSSSIVYIKVLTYLLRMVTAGVCDSAVNRTRLHMIISSQTFYDLLTDSGLICVEYERQVIQLLLELALELVIPPFMTSETVASSDIDTGPAGFLLTTPEGSFIPDKERVYNAGAVRVLIRSLLLFTPKVQLEVLNLIAKLAHAGSFNQENLTSVGAEFIIFLLFISSKIGTSFLSLRHFLWVGCVELLLETICPFLSGSSLLVAHALKIVEVLGAYR